VLKKLWEKRYLLAISWLLLVCLALWTPGNKLPQPLEFDFADKLEHFFVFAVLSFLWSRAGTLDPYKKIKKGRLTANIFWFSIVFPVLAEYIQRLVPNRAFDWGDILANLIGSATGLIVFFILYKRQEKLV